MDHDIYIVEAVVNHMSLGATKTKDLEFELCYEDSNYSWVSLETQSRVTYLQSVPGLSKLRRFLQKGRLGQLYADM